MSGALAQRLQFAVVTFGCVEPQAFVRAIGISLINPNELPERIVEHLGGIAAVCRTDVQPRQHLVL